MGNTLDLGRRIEIHSMDRHCQDISIGLYRKEFARRPAYLVHSYSGQTEADGRVAFIRRALTTLMGLRPAEVGDPAESASCWLEFPCGTDHLRALKRGFLDLCKLPTDAPLEPKPLVVFDKKADCEIRACFEGDGKYELAATAVGDQPSRRALAVARGFAKLCEMQSPEGQHAVVQFPCRSRHDAMIGMLMYRAQNVRAAMKEAEMFAGRGVLAPPSQQ